MKKFFSFIMIALLLSIMLPTRSFAAGIGASGGGKFTVGQTFSVSVVASGAEFNAFQGSISTTGPVSVVSTSAGSANWMSQPSANGGFSGALLGQKVSSFTIATIKLKGTAAGNGSVTVSGVILKNGASTVGTSGGSASYTISKAPELPGAVTVSSSSHPDQATAYETTTIVMNWDKGTGVDGFSYLLDQTADTTPAAKITDANTTATYADKGVGTYYFHIRAHKPDGFGATSHFKITIKEPDPKINTSLSAPFDINVSKSDSFINDVINGSVTGLKISGKTEPNFKANITLTPTPTVPEGKTMSVLADNSGYWELVLDFPVSSGFHKLTVQGQNEKILTPISEEIQFEISQAKGGTINILTTADEHAPVVVTPVKAEQSKLQYILNRPALLEWIGLALLFIALIISIICFKKRKKNKSRVNFN